MFFCNYSEASVNWNDSLSEEYESETEEILDMCHPFAVYGKCDARHEGKQDGQFVNMVLNGSRKKNEFQGLNLCR